MLFVLLLSIALSSLEVGLIRDDIFFVEFETQQVAQREHLSDSPINCTALDEAWLAQAVAELVLLQGNGTVVFSEPHKCDASGEYAYGNFSQTFVAYAPVSTSAEIVGKLVWRDDDARYAWLVGARSGAPLDTAWADAAASYSVANHSVLIVARKTRPIDAVWCALGGDVNAACAVHRHRVHALVAPPFAAGERLQLTFVNGNPHALPPVSTVPTRCAALHVNLLGFDARTSERKWAFLSYWAGAAGAVDYARFNATPFALVDDASSATVYAGAPPALRFAADDLSEDVFAVLLNRSSARADVYLLDFSAFAPNETQTVRVHLPGCGSSLPFTVVGRRNESAAASPYAALRDAARRYLTHARSGVSLAPPATDYVRPAPRAHSSFARPRQSRRADGLSVSGGDAALWYDRTDLLPDIFATLADEEANAPFEACGNHTGGGLMDAGDWDSMSAHHRVSVLLLELHAALGGADASLLDDAEFALRFYRDAQRADGAVPSLLETTRHPAFGELSWLSRTTWFCGRADPYSAFFFAAAAAKLARLRASDAGWLDAAARAFDWAQLNADNVSIAGCVTEPECSTLRTNLRQMAQDKRAHAALELALATDNATRAVYVAHFENATRFAAPQATTHAYNAYDQRDSCFLLLRDGAALAVDAAIVAHCRAAFDTVAATLRDRVLSGCGYPRAFLSPYRPALYGFASPVDAIELLRAHALGVNGTRAAAELIVGFALGANPLDTSFVSGVTARAVQHALHVDSESSERAAPAGIATFG